MEFYFDILVHQHVDGVGYSCSSTSERVWDTTCGWSLVSSPIRNRRPSITSTFARHLRLHWPVKDKYKKTAKKNKITNKLSHLRTAISTVERRRFIGCISHVQCSIQLQYKCITTSTQCPVKSSHILLCFVKNSIFACLKWAGPLNFYFYRWHSTYSEKRLRQIKRFDLLSI